MSVFTASGEFEWMTLGTAVRLVREGTPPCACCGPWPRCFCQQELDHAQALKRAAHIAVKLIDGRRDLP
jgi:hypothetical protein